jgi:hypothetical protein
LSWHKREATQLQVVKICEALADDFFHTDSRVVGLFRQAADSSHRVSRLEVRRPADVLAIAVGELNKHLEGRQLERFHPLFTSFVYGLGTRAGLSFVRALSMQQQAELLGTLLSMHETLRMLSHPRSGTLNARKRPAGMREGVHQLAGLLASCSDARSSVLHHFMTRFVSVEASVPSDSWASSKRAIRVIARSIDIVPVMHPDVLQSVWDRILVLIGCASSDSFQAPIQDVVACARSLVSECGLNNSHADLLLKAVSKMLANCQATLNDVTQLLHLMESLWLSKLQSRHALTTAIHVKLVEVFKAGTTAPGVIVAGMQVYKTHHHLRLVCPKLFLEVDQVVADHYRTQPLSHDDLVDLPEFFWVMQSLRVCSPELTSASSRRLVQMWQGGNCSDDLWRSSLRLSVISSQNGCIDLSLVEELSRQCLHRKNSRRSPFNRVRQVNNVLYEDGCRGLLPPMHDFRDLTDFLQMLAYTGSLRTQAHAASVAMQEVHGCAGALRDKKNWEPLLQQSQQDREVRNFIVSCLKLTAVRSAEIVNGAPLIGAQANGSGIQAWLWEFISSAVRDGRMDRENLPARRTPQEDFVSTFESTIRAAILQLCREHRSDTPTASHFIEELALFTDIAWSTKKVAIEIDGPVHYVPLSSHDQQHWLPSATKSSSDVPSILDDKRPNLGFLSKTVNAKTSLRSAAFNALGWRTLSVSCFDVWPEYMSAKASRGTDCNVNAQLLDRLAVALNEQGLWSHLK